ncbi:hypothetical protein BU26DRAFT_520451 [Trematosphaeria pertusa]|uniref:Uncharacterized protein n=1 Tax=Trematosphaeria pertusa TaxID=390896 RepID=A0A6A6I9Z7_9PLEO|nr:uncharacterized protein BU26DRAFT_520451 [Trematosphaeria pertusa]KAF2247201.1 hypothetical protein BU26DRAFT_520451 [Trematosphaeria pertusa]
MASRGSPQTTYPIQASRRSNNTSNPLFYYQRLNEERDRWSTLKAAPGAKRFWADLWTAAHQQHAAMYHRFDKSITRGLKSLIRATLMTLLTRYARQYQHPVYQEYRQLLEQNNDYQTWHLRKLAYLMVSLTPVLDYRTGATNPKLLVTITDCLPRDAYLKWKIFNDAAERVRDGDGVICQLLMMMLLLRGLDGLMRVMRHVWEGEPSRTTRNLASEVMRIFLLQCNGMDPARRLKQVGPTGALQAWRLSG